MNLVSVVMCGVLLSKESLLSALNLPRLLFFVPLILIGYTSVVITVIEMVEGVTYIGHRPDLAVAS